MKQLSFFILLVVSLNCMASGQQADKTKGTPADIKAMLACMHKISNADIKKMKNKAQAINSKIEWLCKTGERSEAVKAARAYLVKNKKDPVTLQINRCAAMAGIQKNDARSHSDARNITIKNVCGRKVQTINN